MKLTEVVAAVLYNDNGEYLLSSRPEGKPYAGYWEFAGGKIEAGETAVAALARELDEELGIVIDDAHLWLTLTHQYEHAHVRLQFFRIAANQWHGTLTAKEGQSWAWQNTEQNNVTPMLPANAPIIQALAIPQILYGDLATGLLGANGQVYYQFNGQNALSLNWGVADMTALPVDIMAKDAWLLVAHQDTDFSSLVSWLSLGVARPVVLAVPHALYHLYPEKWSQLLNMGLHGCAILTSNNENDETINP